MKRRFDHSAPLAVLVPVGPQPIEVERLVDLAESLAAYEAGPGWLVNVDDSPSGRGLDRVVRAACGPLTPVALHHVREGSFSDFRHGGGLCSSVLMGMQWIQANTDAEVVLKLDTDSLVINPFRQQLLELFSNDPSLAMAGAYTLSPNGTPRLWHHHAVTVRRMLRPAFDWRRMLGVKRGGGGDGASGCARLIRAALANGYDPGEHCLGGGYAVSRTLLERMARAGYLADPLAWMRVDLAEDVMVGIHARAVGMTMANFVGAGEVFGVRYQGLAGDPESLVERGFSVIHSVRNDPLISEAAIRQFFKKRREAGAVSSSSSSSPRTTTPAWRSDARQLQPQ